MADPGVGETLEHLVTIVLETHAGREIEGGGDVDVDQAARGVLDARILDRIGDRQVTEERTEVRHHGVRGVQGAQLQGLEWAHVGDDCGTAELPERPRSTEIVGDDPLTEGFGDDQSSV